MRGITEERLKELMNESERNNKGGLYSALFFLITNECQEINQQNINKLLPMNECNIGWLVKRKDSDIFDMCTSICSHDSIVTSDTQGICVLRSGYDGCFPPPVYRKES